MWGDLCGEYRGKDDDEGHDQPEQSCLIPPQETTDIADLVENARFLGFVDKESRWIRDRLIRSRYHSPYRILGSATA